MFFTFSTQKNHLIQEPYTDFLLSRKASLLSPKIIEFYEYTTGGFIHYLFKECVFEPEAISSSHVRGYLSEVNCRKITSATVHTHARSPRQAILLLSGDFQL